MISKIIRNSLSNSSGFIITAVVTFFITPFVVRTLGKEIYGIWVLVIGLTGYMGLLDFGMRTAIVKYVSEYQATDSFTEINRLCSTALTLFVGTGILCWFALIIFSFFFRTIFNIVPDNKTSFLILFLVIGADVFFTFGFMVYQGSIVGFQRYDISVRNGLIAFSIRSALIIIFLKIGYSIIALSLIVMGSNLVGYLLNFLSCRHICYQLHFSIMKFSSERIVKLWQYSWKSFVTNISDRIIYYSDSIIIGIFLDPEQITIYAIASSLVIYVRQLILSISGVLVPAFSSADANNDLKTIHQIVIQGSKMILFILIPISCVLGVMGGDFINLWMGSGFGKSYQILLVLLISQFIALSQYGITLALYGLAEHSILAKVNMLIAIANILLSVIFVQYWGLIGVALGSAIPLCVLRIILIPRRVFMIIDMKLTYFFKKVILPLCVVLFFYIFILLTLKHGMNTSSWFKFLSVLGISLIMYCPLFYFIGLNRHEKLHIKTFFNERSE